MLDFQIRHNHYRYALALSLPTPQYLPMLSGVLQDPYRVGNCAYSFEYLTYKDPDSYKNFMRMQKSYYSFLNIIVSLHPFGMTKAMAHAGRESRERRTMANHVVSKNHDHCEQY